MMLRAYKKRPDTFRFRVLEYINGTNKDLRLAEQRWLDKIKDTELYWTPNIHNNTVRYYNQKKNSSGGNGSANKGNSNIGGHNSFIWEIVEPCGTRHLTDASNKLRREKGWNWLS